MKKKVVFVINYFYPDYASTGQLMTELCLDIQKDFEITVIAAQSSYAGQETEQKKIYQFDQLEDINIIRIKVPKVEKHKLLSRINYIISYFVLALIALLKIRGINIIYTISQPPILGGLIGTIGKMLKKSKHIYNIQDFNPEQAEVIKFTKRKWLFKLARFIDNMNCKLADHIVLVGADMQQTLQKRFVGKLIPNHSVINNWTDESKLVPLTKEDPIIQEFLRSKGLDGKFIVMYSGNIGLYYDLENIIKVTRVFNNINDIAFVFIGSGALKLKLEEFVENNGIRNTYFLPYQPKEFIKYSLNCADVHLVVNQKGIKGVSVPSKIYGVMAVGKPILGVLEEGSEAHRIIKDSQSGIVVEPCDYKGIINAVTRMYNMEKSTLERIGEKGRKYLEQNLRKESSINNYRELLKKI